MDETELGVQLMALLPSVGGRTEHFDEIVALVRGFMLRLPRRGALALDPTFHGNVHEWVAAHGTGSSCADRGILNHIDEIVMTWEPSTGQIAVTVAGPGPASCKTGYSTAATDVLALIQMEIEEPEMCSIAFVQTMGASLVNRLAGYTIRASMGDSRELCADFESFLLGWLIQVDCGVQIGSANLDWLDVLDAADSGACGRYESRDVVSAAQALIDSVTERDPGARTVAQMLITGIIDGCLERDRRLADGYIRSIQPTTRYRFPRPTYRVERFYVADDSMQTLVNQAEMTCYLCAECKAPVRDLVARGDQLSLL